MDSHFTNSSGSTNSFEFDHEIIYPNFNQSPNIENGFSPNSHSFEMDFLDLPSTPPDLDPDTLQPYASADSPDEFSDTVLKFINQILNEDKIEEKPSMFLDPLAVREAEKSLYEVIGQKYPPSPYKQTTESLDDNFFGSSSEYSTNSSSSAGYPIDPKDFSSSAVNHLTQLTAGNGIMDPYTNLFTDSNSILQFKKGLEEASKFIPMVNPLVIDLEKYSLQINNEVAVKVEKNDVEDSRILRKNYRPIYTDLDEERNCKQSAIYTDESELSEMFDKVLLGTDSKGEPVSCCIKNPRVVENVSKTRQKNPSQKAESVDLQTILINCAQSVAADDHRTANEQLKLIRQHSSPTGNASQRVAHFFANGLEARMAGTGTEIYTALSSKRISAVEKLKAYQVNLASNPFKKISIFFANKMILEMSSSASTVHIIDFGIVYGFQWPILIHDLSKRAGGPPKLRITGIEHPQAGFRPAELVEETGRRLSNYCERFNVPFEYNAIAVQKWETINIKDLNLKNDEFIAVNTLFRFDALHDETVIENSPRDAVLTLIRNINPGIFVHGIVNGTYSAPFFVTRFREALFHFSASFEIFESTLTNEDIDRLNLETEFYGRGIMNIIACEGTERVVRPETYKQWQVREKRAGLKTIPLNQELVKKFRAKVKMGYHKDFVFDQDGPWMLQGWKGRILYASSCWVSA
jgi:hypothetical protein